MPALTLVSPVHPAALLGAWPTGLPVPPAAFEVVAALPFAAAAWLLWRHGRRQRGWLGRVFTRLIVLTAAGVAVRVLATLPGSVWGWVAVVVVLAAWWAVAGLARALPRALARWQWAAGSGDVERFRLLEAAVAASGDGVMIAAADRSATGLRIVYANPAFEDLTGYAASEAVGLSPSVFAADTADSTDREDLEEATGRGAVRAALGSTEPTRLEVPSRRKDGSRVWCEWHVVPVADAAGRCTHWVSVLRDTTARRQAEEDLRRTAELLKAVADGASDAVYVKDRHSRYLLFNPAAARLVGVPVEAVVGKDDAAIFEPESARGVAARDRRILETGRTEMSESHLTSLGGVTRTYQSFKAPYRDGHGHVIGIVGISRDVTEARLAERTLREREELLRSVIGHIPCGVFWKGRDSVFLGCNDRVARDHGRTSAAEVVGRTDAELGVSPADAARFRDYDRRVIETGEEVLDVETTETRRDGTKATILTSKVPLRDGSGAVVGVLGVYQDVTDRKRLEEQYRQAQKMEAVGRLAGGIAHDFNNLLTVICGNAELLADVTAADPVQSERVEDIRGAADRAAELVRQLLTFSRRQPAQPELIDLGDAVAATAGMLDRLLGERITVQTEPADRPVRVRIDRGQLEQVVMNLAVNAGDAMPDGGVLTLRVEEGAVPSSHPEVPPTRTARLVVSDTGAGMTDDVKARIFEPFFTTKGPDKGTGLGLATVYGIVEQAGGRIDVQSTPGAGATFRIDFPWCAPEPIGPVDTPPPGRGPRPPGGRGRRVLLAEDEDGVRAFARLALQAHGYDVTDAPDGETALERLDADGPPDVLITDVVMPGMAGGELARRVRAAWPGVGVVFVSGYVPDPDRLTEVPGAVFLPKPFTPDELARAASRALARVRRPAENPPVAG